MLSRIANFDDVDPLRLEPAVDFSFVAPGTPIPRDADVVILLGTKSTLGDLAFLEAQGWHHDIHAHVRAGGRVLGLCGGYQMLGRTIRDPDGVDGAPGEAGGLGLLDVETTMEGAKSVRPVQARSAAVDAVIDGYEIHMGTTTGADAGRPFAWIDGVPDGAASADGVIAGTYLHGLFSSDTFRAGWLARMHPEASSALAYERAVDAALDELADGLERSVALDGLLD